MFWLVCLIAFAIHHWHPKRILNFQSIGTDSAISTDETLVHFVVYRIMVACALYHILMAITMFRIKDENDSRLVLETGFWPLKMLLIFGLCFSFLFIPQNIIRHLFWPGIISAGIFLLLQVILLVDLACTIAEYFVSKYEETEGAIYKWSLIGLTALFYGAIGVAAYWLIKTFTETTDRIMILSNLIMTIILSGFSLLNKVQEAHAGAGIFPAAFIGTYNSFLLATALYSKKSIIEESKDDILSILGAIFGLLSITYSAFSSGQDSHKLGISSQHSGNSTPFSKKENESPYGYSFFHLMFAMASFYVALLITQWKQAFVDEAKSTIVIEHTKGTFWARLSMSWLLALLYIWTLFAPVLFPGRHFV